MRYFLVLVVHLVVISCGSEHKRPIEKDILSEQEVKDFIAQYDKAWEARDTVAMKDLMSGSYSYSSSTGTTSAREAIMSWFTPADKYKVDTATRSEVVILHLKGNTAIVSSRWIGSGQFGNEKFNDDQRCGLVIQKLDGKARVLAEYCTQIVK